MASYDSDSSDAGESFTETAVLLGYASEEPTEDAISQLGGYPVSLQHSRKFS
jgi:pre-rRNA-processing protein TSR4